MGLVLRSVIFFTVILFFGQTVCCFVSQSVGGPVVCYVFLLYGLSACCLVCISVVCFVCNSIGWTVSLSASMVCQSIVWTIILVFGILVCYLVSQLFCLSACCLDCQYRVWSLEFRN